VTVVEAVVEGDRDAVLVWDGLVVEVLELVLVCEDVSDTVLVRLRVDVRVAERVPVTVMELVLVPVEEGVPVPVNVELLALLGVTLGVQEEVVVCEDVLVTVVKRVWLDEEEGVATAVGERVCVWVLDPLPVCAGLRVGVLVPEFVKVAD